MDDECQSAPRAHLPCPGVLDARQHKQQVRQPVHVADDGWSDRLLETDLHHLTLRPANDGSGHVKLGRALRAARQHKRRERLQLRVLTMEHLLEPSHLMLSDPQRLQLQAGAFRATDIGTDVVLRAELPGDGGDRSSTPAIVKCAFTAHERMMAAVNGILDDPSWCVSTSEEPGLRAARLRASGRVRVV